MGAKATRALSLDTTPVGIVQHNNPLFNSISKISKRWNKRWPDIDQPWPQDGTFDPEVIRTMQVLVRTYKAGQKTGKKGRVRKEKRELEVAVLELFLKEGQKLNRVHKECQDKITSAMLSTVELEKPDCMSKTEQREEPEQEADKSPNVNTTKQMPVIIGAQHLDYRPLSPIEMLDIVAKLPPLQNGAYQWISKFDEISVGLHLAMGDFKQLISRLMGIYVLQDVLTLAGLQRYIDTNVYDAEPFAANRSLLWCALRGLFPLNVHPDSILIDPLGDTENPRAYVVKAQKRWRDVTGNDPNFSLLWFNFSSIYGLLPFIV